MTSAGGDHCSATVLNEAQPDDLRVLSELRADSRIEFTDKWDEQRDELRRLRPPADPEVIAEPKRWVYYPWRRIVVGVLGPTRMAYPMAIGTVRFVSGLMNELVDHLYH